MSLALPARVPPRLQAALPWALLALCVALWIGSLAFHDRLFRRGATAAKTEAEAAPAPPATVVSLTEPKFRAAGIALDQAKVEALASEVGVSGRIDPDQNRDVQVRPRASGVIREVRVAQGQEVKKGQVLAVLDSADVGTARLHLLARLRELETVRIEARWRERVAANVAALIPELIKSTEAEVIQRQYADRPLGTFRATLLQAYAEFDIAAHEEKKTSDLSDRQILGEHPRFVTRHTRESAQAKFGAAVEQARFDANQQSLVANQQARLAEGEVIDAAQRLRLLGAPEDVDALLSGKSPAPKTAPDDVTRYELVAPFDGTVIHRAAVPSQKAEPTDSLFEVADLATVWVTANLPESDFNLLPRLRSGTLRVTATAYPGRSFAAKLLSVGATVETSTRTVAVLAEAHNPEGLLKLGMFVRIVLDGSKSEDALTVPGSSVVAVDGRDGVFVPRGDDGRTFALRPVKLGRQAGDRQVVASGLKAGDRVVSAGVFTLKSELILQNETEEE